jgi:hypothetical protein
VIYLCTCGYLCLILFRVFKCSYNYYHFEHHAREDNLVHSDVINVNSHIASGEQIAECLTKGLGVKDCVAACNKMGMIDIYRSSCGGVLSCIHIWTVTSE